MTSSFANLISVILVLSFFCGSAPSAEPVTPGSVAVVIIDDLTSGGAAPGELAGPKLFPLLELCGARPLEIRYHLIQEKVEAPVAATLEGWSLKGPPPPSDSLPASAYQKAAIEFLKAAAAFKIARSDWESGIETRFSEFVSASNRAQVALEARWMNELQIRKGRDFRRSAVAATILAAFDAVRPAERAYLVIASDCVDQPPAGEVRVTRFSPAEVPHGVHLIFVTPPGGKIDPTLFSQLTNPVETVASLPEAMESIRSAETPSSAD